MQLYKLKELYSISSGLSKPASQFGYGNPFLSFSIVFNNYHIPSSLIDLVNTSPLEIKRFSIKRGDVFVTRTSEKLDELGKSCVALQDYEKATFNGFCKRLRPIVNESIILPEYAQYLFRSKQFTNQIIYSCPMSTRASLNEEILNTIVLNIHSLSEQRHIVDIIGSLDNKIENNNKLLEKCYIFLNLNMKKLMIGKDKKIISSFDDIEIISSGIDKFNSGKIYLDTSCVSDNSIVDISNKVTYTDRPSRANMKPIKNSVWFAKLKSSPKHIIVKDYSNEILDNCIFSTGFLGIKIDNVKFNLLSTYFTSDVFEKEKDSLSIGATMQSINNVTFKGMYIPNFSPTDYISFNNLSEPILKLIYKTELENIKLRKLKNIYLAKFF